nr:MAG TPA: structural protein [Caudoviricetes sp.]
MKDFYSICEPWSNDIEFYRKGKRKTVLKTIKPICEAFGISDYDYILNDE